MMQPTGMHLDSVVVMNTDKSDESLGAAQRPAPRPGI